MATATATPASSTDPGKPAPCSTQDVLKKIEDDVTAAKLQQQIANQTVTTLEDHLKQLQDYDSKIDAAVDAYKQGIEAVCAAFDDLRKAVEQGKGSYECLVPDEKERCKVIEVLNALRRRRKTLETCEWDLQLTVIDKQCKLGDANAEVERADKELNLMLALLTERQTELTALKALKDALGGCSGTATNECRYAFYLDLEKRLEVECISVEQYLCDLVDKVKALDAARQKATAADGAARTVQDQLDRVTKLHDDLVAGWQDELCAAVNAGAIPALPPDLASACAGTATPAPTSGATAHGNAESGVKEPAPDHGSGEQPTTPPSGAA